MHRAGAGHTRLVPNTKNRVSGASGVTFPSSLERHGRRCRLVRPLDPSSQEFSPKFARILRQVGWNFSVERLTHQPGEEAPAPRRGLATARAPRVALQDCLGKSPVGSVVARSRPPPSGCPAIPRGRRRLRPFLIPCGADALLQRFRPSVGAGSQP